MLPSSSQFAPHLIPPHHVGSGPNQRHTWIRHPQNTGVEALAPPVTPGCCASWRSAGGSVGPTHPNRSSPLTQPTANHPNRQPTDPPSDQPTVTTSRPPVLRVLNPFPDVARRGSQVLGPVPGRQPRDLRPISVTVQSVRGPAGPKVPDHCPSVGQRGIPLGASDPKPSPSDSFFQGVSEYELHTHPHCLSPGRLHGPPQS